MPLFNLPIVHISRTPASHAPIKSALSRKRKRAASPDDEPLEELKDDASNPHREQSTFSVALTNPLSLAPDEIVQYRAAGLSLDKLIPSGKDFPHRRVRNRRRKGVVHDDGHEAGYSSRQKTERLAASAYKKEYGLKLKHLGVLTAVLHRCLGEGDIARASRAWALLLRTHVAGKAVELRTSGYWGIGAELLIREREKKTKRRAIARDEDSESEEDEPTQGSQGTDTDQDLEGLNGEARWGTKEGLARAKEYYERLILEYPYKRQYVDSVNGLDFWPAMLSCEVYGIQYEQREALRKIAVQEGSQDHDVDDVSDTEMEDDEDEYTFSQRVEEKRRLRKDEKLWQDREEVRRHTLAAVHAVTARMDELMNSPPYSDSHRLLRLRAMLCLYVGDLCVPERPPGNMEGGEDNEDEDEDGLDVLGELAAKRIEKRQRKANRDAGLKAKRAEKKKASRMFKKITEVGRGAVEDANLVAEDSEEEMAD